ncbi:MAG: hypothetical protein KDA22_16195 [Phycisphaerales bacterium]|nr:hypothetical protein [Phycisphaerales bacterium]
MTMRRSRAIRSKVFAVLAASLPVAATAAARQADMPADVLPPDPADWVCDLPDRVPDEVVEEFCGTADLGIPLPAPLRSPPPLSDVDAKNAYDLMLQTFLNARVYAGELGWIHDQNWRLTGPYVGPLGEGASFGTHPAVRVWYSPEIVTWLCNGRRGEVPDGAMLIKEMHGIDAATVTILPDQCMVIEGDPAPTGWTVIVKSNSSSRDGWYWGYYGLLQTAQTGGDPPPNNELGNPPIFDPSGITSQEFYQGNHGPVMRNPDWYPTGLDPSKPRVFPDVVYPNEQYGNYCMNCHSSAISEETFATLDNVLGPGIVYKHFDAEASGSGLPPSANHLPSWLSAYNAPASERPYVQPLPHAAPGFHGFFHQITPVRFADAWSLRLPAQTWDHIVSGPNGPSQFLTSDQCISCHDATYSNSGLPNMMLQKETLSGQELFNLSPYAEWSASPMGLAGRDPIFFAQLQSETNNLPDQTTCIEDLCLSCHGVMGKRQLAIDTPPDGSDCESLFPVPPQPGVPSGQAFRLSMVTQWPQSNPNDQQVYGALARDGISCTVCHHVSPDGLGAEASFTGNFVTGSPQEIYGPYPSDTVIPIPMQNTLAITPLEGEQLTNSIQGVCQSCHNILLPVFTNGGAIVGGAYEQSTGLEWQNSVYGPGGSDQKSCIDCHMPKTFHGEQLEFEIANIESNEFAPTSNRLPDADITLTPRSEFGRHSLHGLNLFLNQMFQQFPLVLGGRQVDPMAGPAPVPALINGADSMIDMAQLRTAQVQIQGAAIVNGALEVTVKVTNKAGHFLPSGVGFRRMFLEFAVLDDGGNPLWASGRTNALGFIVKGTTGQVLKSEQPLKFPNTPFQPHYQVIDREDEVQIYQELVEDSDGDLTSSFLRRYQTVKDNRIRPQGFNPAFFADNPSEFIQELAIVYGQAADDPYYTDPALTGADVVVYRIPWQGQVANHAAKVRATLYNQSIPPAYLQQRFNDANAGPGEDDEIRRLYYVTSHLNTDGLEDELGRKVLKDWKLFVTKAEAPLDF